MSFESIGLVAHADGGKTPRVHFELRDKHRSHGFGTAFRQIHVAGLIAYRIRVAFDLHLQIRIGFEALAMLWITAADSALRRSLSVSNRIPCVTNRPDDGITWLKSGVDSANRTVR